MENKDLINRFFELAVTEWGYYTAEKVQFRISNFLGDVYLDGKAALDIGCGTGLMSIYAACKGAAAVIGLEPEEAGTTSGYLKEFNKMVTTLGLTTATGLSQTLQEFDPQGQLFDLVLMDSSINHLEEEACIHLQNSPEARNRYLEIFNKISSLMKSGGIVIIRDCSRYNFFAALGIKNPLCPVIEWHKHQSPKFWADLMGQCGFTNPKIEWPLLTPKLQAVRKIVCTQIGAYFLRSSFRLVIQKT